MISLPDSSSDRAGRLRSNEVRFAAFAGFATCILFDIPADPFEEREGTHLSQHRAF